MALRERTRERLPPGIFDLPVDKMREGYYADAYFKHARATLLQDGRHPRVVMQLFQKRDAYLGGMAEAIAILKLCSYDWDELTVHALYDGDRVSPWETVMTIEGDYTLFAHLETAYLGVLARRTLITTNVVRVLEAANGKPIIFMPARHDHHRVQTALDVARTLGPKLWGVRLDTSEMLVDRSLWEELGDFKPTGVNERLVHKVRDALDNDGFEHVKIVASGGFTIDKIIEFEEK